MVCLVFAPKRLVTEEALEALRAVLPTTQVVVVSDETPGEVMKWEWRCGVPRRSEMNHLLKMEWSLPYALPTPAVQFESVLPLTAPLPSQSTQPAQPETASQALLQRLRVPFTSQCYAVAEKDVWGVPGLCVGIAASKQVSYSYTPLHYTASQTDQAFYDQYDAYRFFHLPWFDG